MTAFVCPRYLYPSSVDIFISELNLAKAGDEVLIFSSWGGTVDDALKLAKTIRAKKLNTRLEDFCASASNLVFAAGIERYCSDSAQMFFHEVLEYVESELNQSTAEQISNELQMFNEKYVDTLINLIGNPELRDRFFELMKQQTWIDANQISELFGAKIESEEINSEDELMAKVAKFIHKQKATALSNFVKEKHLVEDNKNTIESQLEKEVTEYDSNDKTEVANDKEEHIDAFAGQAMVEGCDITNTTIDDNISEYVAINDKHLSTHVEVIQKLNKLEDKIELIANLLESIEKKGQKSNIKIRPVTESQLKVNNDISIGAYLVSKIEKL